VTIWCLLGAEGRLTSSVGSILIFKRTLVSITSVSHTSSRRARRRWFHLGGVAAVPVLLLDDLALIIESPIGEAHAVIADFGRILRLLPGCRHNLHILDLRSPPGLNIHLSILIFWTLVLANRVVPSVPIVRLQILRTIGVIPV
jgi:hypothetical protein